MVRCLRGKKVPYHTQWIPVTRDSKEPGILSLWFLSLEPLVASYSIVVCPDPWDMVPTHVRPLLIIPSYSI